jgi:hypothetical protein
LCSEAALTACRRLRSPDPPRPYRRLSRPPGRAGFWSPTDARAQEQVADVGVSARQAAIQTLANRVSLQAGVLAFEKVFLLQALPFVVVLPLVFLLRAPRRHDAKKVMVDVE